ncbi:MAG: two pore domain potassium channel family protein [Pseudolabrys sp.]|nr:two pore domain potassium channel family protein [Pseudolabrys sp.]MBV9260755.1 two pore domain potassium channel family protein [Pseudolabrys sp.]
MLYQLLNGTLVSLFNFGVHAVATALIVAATRRMVWMTSDYHAFWRVAALMFVTMVALMVAHLIEITIWALHYGWIGLDVGKATHFEFAFENYTALGYGDPPPPQQWRLTGPVTALNGLLLVGWSVAVIFEVIRMAEVKFEHLPIRKTSRK